MVLELLHLQRDVEAGRVGSENTRSVSARMSGCRKCASGTIIDRSGGRGAFSGEVEALQPHLGEDAAPLGGFQRDPVGAGQAGRNEAHMGGWFGHSASSSEFLGRGVVGHPIPNGLHRQAEQVHLQDRQERPVRHDGHAAVADDARGDLAPAGGSDGPGPHGRSLPPEVVRVQGIRADDGPSDRHRSLRSG